MDLSMCQVLIVQSYIKIHELFKCPSNKNCSFERSSNENPIFVTFICFKVVYLPRMSRNHNKVSELYENCLLSDE